jgi:hypothetical protein
VQNETAYAGKEENNRKKIFSTSYETAPQEIKNISVEPKKN